MAKSSEEWRKAGKSRGKVPKSGNEWLGVATYMYMWCYVAKSGFMSAILDVRSYFWPFQIDWPFWIS